MFTQIKNRKKHSYEIDMCNGNLFLKLLEFSFPLMFMGILQLLYNAADLIVVSHFSSDVEAVGAIGSTSNLINLCVNLFMGLSIGTNVVVAKLYGAKEYDRVSKIVHTSLTSSIIIGLFLGVFGIIFTKDLLHLMSNDLDLSRVYLQIYFIGMPFNLLYNFAAAVLRAIGDTKRPLYYLSITGVLNVILNLIFCIVFDMSVKGVAIATVISQIVSCVLIITTLMKTKECFKFTFKHIGIDKSCLAEITKVGLPAGIQSTIFSISNVIIQASVNKFGYISMNGNAAATQIEGFVYVSMNSVYHAALAFTAQNYGAKKAKNIHKVTLYSLIIVTMFGLVLGIPLFSIGRPFIKIFTEDPESIEVAYIRFHYLTLPYFLCGIMDVMVGVIRGMGYSILPMVTTIIGVCGFRIGWIYLVFYRLTDFTNLADLNYLYISYPISWIITFVVHLITYFIISKRKFNEFNEELKIA